MKMLGDKKFNTQLCCVEKFKTCKLSKILQNILYKSHNPNKI